MTDNPTANELNELADEARELAILAEGVAPDYITMCLLGLAGMLYDAARFPAAAIAPIPRMLVDAQETFTAIRSILEQRAA